MTVSEVSAIQKGLRFGVSGPLILYSRLTASGHVRLCLRFCVSCRGIVAVLTSPPFREDAISQRLMTLAEGLFEVVSHALFLRPGALQAVLPPDAQSQSQFFDVWLAVAQIRSAII